MSDWAPLLACIGSFLGCGAWLRFVRRRLLDVPGGRSLHTRPTPTSGGIGMLAGLLPAAAVLRIDASLDDISSLALSLACGLSAVGFADDRRGLSVGWRLLAQLLAAVLLLVVLKPGPGATVQAVFMASACLLWLIGFTNLYNFMDGIDGFATTQAAFAGAAAALLAHLHGAPDTLVLLLASPAGVALGFLPWNWPPARLFMGDAGSLLLGFLFAALGVFWVLRAQLPPAAWLILWLPFLLDGTLTLARRASQRQTLTSAHREHAYQRYALRVGSHRPVTLALLALDIGWLLPLSVLALRFPAWGPGLFLLAALPFFLIFFRSPPEARLD